MRAITTLGKVLIVALIISACSHGSHGTRSMPPGQAKKVTGSKSAKPFAPGQQKKHRP